MKFFLRIAAVCLAVFAVATLATTMPLSPVAEAPPQVQVPDVPAQSQQFFFDGQWMPDVDSVKIGPQNFKTLQNMRYTINGIEGVKGYTEINTWPLIATAADLTSYTEDDDNGRFTVTTTQIDVSGLLGGDGDYVVGDSGYSDFGDRAFKMRFHYKSSADGYVFVGGVGSDNDDILKLNDEFMGIRIYTAGTDDTYWFFDGNYPAGYSQVGDSIPKSTDYYVEIAFNPSTGTYGAVTATFYSDSDYSVSVSTSTWELHNEVTTGRYIYPVSASLSVGTGWSGEISDFCFWPSGMEIESGYHFKKDHPAESHVIVQADDATGVTRLYQNQTAIPEAGNFTPTVLHTDATGAGLGRFSDAPYGHVAYCNGVESMIWAGDEMPCSAFITSTAAITDAPTNPIDYTEQVNNSLDDADEVAIIGGGIDGYTKLLLHCDGADASTTFTDTVGTHTPVANGDTQLDTDFSKFGTASGLFDGTGDYVSIPDHADWFMDTSKFTIDFWVRFNTVATGTYGLFSQYTDDDNWIMCRLSTLVHNVRFEVKSGGTNTIAMECGWRPAADTWYHFAIIRGWGGIATQWAITVDGAQIGSTTTDSDSWIDSTGTFDIGRAVTQAGPVYTYLNGWIDEFRVNKGAGGARWISAFTPPPRPYSTAARYFLVGSPRPLQGVKFYIEDANSQGSTLTGSCWNGSSYASMTITDNTDTGASLAQTGTVTWSSTVGTAKPKYTDGRYLYWYQFALSAGDATIYQVTLDAPWQDIVDIWDGVYRQPIQLQVYDNSVYEDYTLEVNDDDPTYFGDLGGLLNTEHLVVMFEERMAAIKWLMVAGENNTAAATVTIYYWNGTDWASVGSVSDLTLDSGSTKSLNQSGVMSWNPPTEGQEVEQTLFGTTGYAYKLVWSATLTDGGGDCDVNLVTGIPAQLDIKPFKFPAIYKDRLFLCGFTEGGEGNRCDYSMTHAPQVFNGEETSMGGPQALYFGGAEDLTCGVQLYNRLGSNIFIFYLALKDHETYVLTGDSPEDFAIFPVSLNVGCPAPRTLVTAEMGFEIASDVQRHVAMWLSHTGPVIFDGAVINPIPGIKSYFDPANDSYVGAANIENAFAWFDQTYKEYNLRVGDYWFVYDLARKRWYEKDTGAAELPTCAFPVNATNGVQYVYAGDDSGQMYRLEDGYSWNTTDIDHVIETGDFWPTKSLWDRTVISKFKYIGDLDDSAENITVTHYADGASSGTTVDTIARNTGTYRFFRDTGSENLKGWSHRFRFVSASSDQAGSTDRRFRPLGWAIQSQLLWEDF